MDKNRLEEIVKNSKTLTECLEKLQLRAAGGNYKTLKKYLIRYDINFNHFDANKVRMEKMNLINKKTPLNEILIKDSFYNRTRLKERLYECGIKERKCELCGQDEMWMGKKISLIIDHINGVWNDNRIENLRIVCPNCNATLPTHCGKNTKIKNIESKNKENFYISRRKVERPDYNTLINDIENLGFTKTGKKYNVSDNAIRKWVKFYEKYN